MNIIAIIALTILVMYFMKKTIEAFLNLLTLFEAKKDPNHPRHVRSSGIVINKKTKKLEASGGDKILLPF